MIWGGSQDCCQAYEDARGSFGVKCEMSISFYLILFSGLIALFECLYMWICWNIDKTESTEFGGGGYDSVE